MGSRKDRKLKNYFINNDLQLRMITSSLIYMFVVVLGMLAVVLFPIIQDMLHEEDIEAQYFAAQTFLLLTQRLVPAVMVLFLAIFIHQIMLSHRICGPLVNFSHTFRRIGEGDLSRKVYLRHGDYLKKECDRINEMIDGFSTMIGRIRGDNQKLMRLLEDTLVHIEDLDTRKKTEDTLTVIKKDAETVMNNLSAIKLPDPPQTGSVPQGKAAEDA